MVRIQWCWLALALFGLGAAARGEVARYEGGGMVVFIEPTARDGCKGEIQMNGAVYPFTGRLDGPNVSGQFKVGEDQFDFTATLDGTGMTLKTGGESYRLKFAPQQGRGDAPPVDPRRDDPRQPDPESRREGELERLPWMKPGTRLTYYESSMTTNLFGEELVPDENGDWVDRKDPKRRFRQDSVLRGGEGGGAGYGLRQHDIVAVEDGVIACDSKAFSARPDHKAYILLPGGSSVVGTYQNGVNTWMHPRILTQQLADAEALNDRRAPIQVYRTKYETMNRQWDAIRVVTRIPEGYVQQTYSQETGLLLYSSTAMTGQNRDSTEDIRKGDKPWTARGQTTFTYVQLLSIRDLKLPAGAENSGLPAVYQKGSQFQWQGGVKMFVPGGEGLNAPPSPVGFAVSILSGGKTYAVAAVKDISPGSIDVGIAPPCRAVGPASLGGWVMSPAIFANLQPNQPLDRDPVSGSEIIYLGQNGGLHWVAERGPQHNFTYGYDPRSGLCVRSINSLPLTGLTYDVNLVAR